MKVFLQLYQDKYEEFRTLIANVYQQYAWIEPWEGLTALEREQFAGIVPDMDNIVAQSAIQDLCNYMSRYYYAGYYKKTTCYYKYELFVGGIW